MTARRYGLVSDTHGHFHPRLHELLDGVETILHAGDVGNGVLGDLESIAPVIAVAGNMDEPSGTLPLMRTEPMPFGLTGIAHGHEFPRGKEQRSRALAAAFEGQEVRMILFGHSHEPYLEFYKNTYLVNPGAAGPPRFNLQPSVCLLEWNETTNQLRFDFVPFAWNSRT